jgi:hypothetical protein
MSQAMAGQVPIYPLAFDGAMMLYLVRRSPQPGQRSGDMRMGEQSRPRSRISTGSEALKAAGARQ